jgi:hypothetical protein
MQGDTMSTYEKLLTDLKEKQKAGLAARPRPESRVLKVEEKPKKKIKPKKKATKKNDTRK